MMKNQAVERTLATFMIQTDARQRQIAKTSKAWSWSALVLVLLLGVGVYQSVNAANNRYQRVSSVQPTSQDIYITVSQYELALVQVLSEICPPMLNERQRVRFDTAYNRQLRQFMPRSSNPQQSLRQLSTQRDYRAVLHNVRAWTASYPTAENRALCREFSEMSF